MHPAFSVIFLTTLIGAGQGLYLALYTGQFYSAFKVLPVQDSAKYDVLGSLRVLVLLVAGLVASFFHLTCSLSVAPTKSTFHCWSAPRRHCCASRCSCVPG